jgi:hypothetical protein
MISTRSLAALRVAATLTHCLPHVRARIGVDGRALVEVRAPDEREPAWPAPGAPHVLSPCSFRCAVAQAHRRTEAGEALSFLHLPAGVEPRIDIATPGNGAARPGGLYRVRLADRWLWAFATTLAADVAYESGQPLVDDATATKQVLALGIRPDPATAVSLAYAETTADPGSDAEAAVIDLLESLLARWTMHDLLTAAGGGRVDRHRT